jgi:Ni,Fe-hydrogenase III large subunit
MSRRGRRNMVTSGRALLRYETACQALAEARTVDEVKDIHDQAVAMAAYARLAKNRKLEADAIEIRMRATRRMDQMRMAQKETVGLSAGARGSREKGARVDDKPTLASQGLDKNLAHQARLLGAMDEAAFERKVAEARDGVFRRAVRETEILQSFEVTYETIPERKPGFKRPNPG